MISTFRAVSLASMICCLLGFGVTVGAETYDDRLALNGLTATKTLFDVNVAEAQKLELYLGVIKQTQVDFIRQGITPQIIIAFRGASVRLVTTETTSFTEEDKKSLKRSAELLKELAVLGIRLEVCSIATNLFKINHGTLLPGIHVVGNTFVTLTGYQSKGYALIPIQ